MGWRRCGLRGLGGQEGEVELCTSSMPHYYLRTYHIEYIYIFFFLFVHWNIRIAMPNISCHRKAASTWAAKQQVHQAGAEHSFLTFSRKLGLLSWSFLLWTYGRPSSLVNRFLQRLEVRGPGKNM